MHKFAPLSSVCVRVWVSEFFWLYWSNASNSTLFTNTRTSRAVYFSLLRLWRPSSAYQYTSSVCVCMSLWLQHANIWTCSFACMYFFACVYVTECCVSAALLWVRECVCVMNLLYVFNRLNASNGNSHVGQVQVISCSIRVDDVHPLLTLFASVIFFNKILLNWIEPVCDKRFYSVFQQLLCERGKERKIKTIWFGEFEARREKKRLAEPANRIPNIEREKFSTIPTWDFSAIEIKK